MQKSVAKMAINRPFCGGNLHFLLSMKNYMADFCHFYQYCCVVDPQKIPCYTGCNRTQIRCGPERQAALSHSQGEGWNSVLFAEVVWPR